MHAWLRCTPIARPLPDTPGDRARRHSAENFIECDHGQAGRESDPAGSRTDARRELGRPRRKSDLPRSFCAPYLAATSKLAGRGRPDGHALHVDHGPARRDHRLSSARWPRCGLARERAAAHADDAIDGVAPGRRDQPAAGQRPQLLARGSVRWSMFRWKGLSPSFAAGPVRMMLLDRTSAERTWGNGLRFGAGAQYKLGPI